MRRWWEIHSRSHQGTLGNVSWPACHQNRLDCEPKNSFMDQPSRCTVEGCGREQPTGPASGKGGMGTLQGPCHPVHSPVARRALGTEAPCAVYS